MTRVRQKAPSPHGSSQAFKTRHSDTTDYRVTRAKITAEGGDPFGLVLTRSRPDGCSRTFFCAHADHKLTAFVSRASVVRNLLGGWLATTTDMSATTPPTQADRTEVTPRERC